MRSRTIVVALVLVAATVALATAPTAAAAGNETNATASNSTDGLVDGLVDRAVDRLDQREDVDDEPETTATTTVPDNRTVPAGSERIEPGLMLIEASHDPDTETATLRIAVASTRAVTLTDAGGFLEGGEIDRRTEVLQEGRHTLRMPVTEVDGQVGVSVSTSDTLYAVPIDTGSPDLFEGDPTWQSVQLAGGAGLGGGLLIVGLIAWRRARGGREEVTRIA